MTEFISYVNGEMGKSYIPYHLDFTFIRQDKEVKALKKSIKKLKEEEVKKTKRGKKDGTDDVDIFGDN